MASSYAITRYWPAVLLGWFSLGLLLHFLSPSWDQVAKDGDFAFMPPEMPSLQGQAWLDAGFPEQRSKSQLAIILARPESPLTEADLAIGLDVGRRLQHQLAQVCWQLAESAESSERRQQLLDKALESLHQSIELDQQLANNLATFSDTSSIRKNLDRLAIAYWDRSQLQKLLGDYRAAEADRETALIISEDVAKTPPIGERDLSALSSLVEVWTWHDPVLGAKLGAKHPQARLILLQLSSEFIATGNMQVTKQINEMLNTSKTSAGDALRSGLKIELSGSAALGGDLRRASLLGVQQTEAITILLILAILTFVYRGPMLVGIPLATIAISFWISTAVVAILSQWTQGAMENFGWEIPKLNIFTTTKIFIVVLLFGAGTDFCLFFLARCREELQLHPSTQRRGMERLVAKSWRSVHDGLLASAMTTIIGLGLLYFSEFEKFRSSGPVIGLCLAITIIVSLTFTPAAVCGIGPLAFWPILKRKDGQSLVVGREPWWNHVWQKLSRWVTAQPLTACTLCFIMMTIPAIGGWYWQDKVSYDLASELGDEAPSRRGQRLIQHFFPNADSSPVHLLLVRPQPFETEKDCLEACQKLTEKLYLPGVESVRSLADPLGDYPPGRLMGLFEKDAWRRRVLQSHRFTKEYFVAREEPYRDRLARLDVVLSDNPFSDTAVQSLEKLREVVESEIKQEQSPWYRSTFSYTGTTAGIVDLQQVTQSDESRIRWLVPLGVYLVLVVTFGRPFLSIFLIATVLLSYFTTLGISHGIFSYFYGPDYQGMDWKVPFFLFVILIAVGQDYNVYLASRVFEEQREHGALEGIRRGLMLTGGIITSCGVVMAGTFVSMSSAPVLNWLADLGIGFAISPQDRGLLLKGMIELGVALTIGVLIDTMIVRSVLLPGAMALFVHWGEKVSTKSNLVSSDIGSNR